MCLLKYKEKTKRKNKRTNEDCAVDKPLSIETISLEQVMIQDNSETSFLLSSFSKSLGRKPK